MNSLNAVHLLISSLNPSKAGRQEDKKIILSVCMGKLHVKW